MNNKIAIKNYLEMCLSNLAKGFTPWEDARSARTYASQKLTPAVAIATQHCAWYIYENVCKYDKDKIEQILKGRWTHR